MWLYDNGFFSSLCFFRLEYCFFKSETILSIDTVDVDDVVDALVPPPRCDVAERIQEEGSWRCCCWRWCRRRLCVSCNPRLIDEFTGCAYDVLIIVIDAINNGKKYIIQDEEQRQHVRLLIVVFTVAIITVVNYLEQYRDSMIKRSYTTSPFIDGMDAPCHGRLRSTKVHTTQQPWKRALVRARCRRSFLLPFFETNTCRLR